MSYTEIDAKTVSLACEAYLTARSKKIDDIRENCIRKLMRPQFFGLVKLSRERAIKWLEDDVWHTYNMCTIRGADKLMIVEGLLALANASIRNNNPSKVNVDSEAAYILRKFL